MPIHFCGSPCYNKASGSGTYAAEIVGHNAAWEITPATARNTFAFTLSEGAMDPAGRMTLELIPFSRYK